MYIPNVDGIRTNVVNVKTCGFDFTYVFGFLNAVPSGFS